jgi:DNA-binding NarL/FixJ family response regulator
MPATPIVLLTTCTDPHITKEALTAGLDAFIDKSEGARTLIDSIQQLLASEVPPFGHSSIILLARMATGLVA